MTKEATYRDDVIAGDGVHIAARDYGGDGHDLLLVHGGWRTLADWNLMLPYLRGDHRVVSMDLRCHGASGSGPWAWGAILNDIRAVVGFYGLRRPSMAGHSLGGMIVSLCGTEFDDCGAVVNLDANLRPGLDDRPRIHSSEHAWVRDFPVSAEAGPDALAALTERTPASAGRQLRRAARTRRHGRIVGCRDRNRRPRLLRAAAPSASGGICDATR